MASHRSGDHLAPFWLLAPPLAGLALSVVWGPSADLPPALARVSQIAGWTYFVAWSISFYPQLYLNFRRKSVSGLSPDFQVLNLLGFASYAIYNAALFWSPSVRREYAARHGGEVPAVHLNDVFFGVHAALVTAATLSQFFLYDAHGPGRDEDPAPWADEGEAAWVEADAEAAALEDTAGRGGDATALTPSGTSGASASASTPAPALAPVPAQTSAPGWALRRGRVLLRPSTAASLAIAGAVALVAAALALKPASTAMPFPLTWLGLLYALSFVKLGVTLTKYVPQALLNRRLRSTIGWNIWTVVLDAEGGVLSVFQELLDCQARRDWSPVVGNPAKFGLGFVSLAFDAIFFTQHLLYAPIRGRRDEAERDQDAKERLLPADEL